MPRCLTLFQTNAFTRHLELELLPVPAAQSGLRMGLSPAAPYLQPVLLPVHDKSSDLLVHEYQDGAKQSWDERSHHRPPRVGSYGVDEPPAVVSGRLQQSTHISLVSQPSYFTGLDFPLHPRVTASPSPGFTSPRGSAVPASSLQAPVAISPAGT